MPQAVTEKPEIKPQQNRTKAATPTVAANETTVSANLVDLGGTTWAGALITINFQPAPNIPGPYFWGGGLFSLRPQLTADGNGHFSITLPDNTTITPAGSTWQFVIAPNATMPAVIFNMMVAGSSMDISSVFTAQSYQVSLGVIQSLPLPRAYGDSFVATPTNDGQIYFNTDLQQIRFWDSQLTGWRSIGGDVVDLPAGTDLNNLPGAGYYQIQDPANAPTVSTWPWVINQMPLMQFAVNWLDPVPQLFCRLTEANQPSGFSPWRTILWGDIIGLPDGTDLDALPGAGFWQVANPANAPVAGMSYPWIVNQFPLMQFAINWQQTPPTLYCRITTAADYGGFTPWFLFQTTPA